MCRCVSTEKLWPGDSSPALAVNATPARATPTAVGAAALRHGRVGEHAVDLGTAEAPMQLLQRHEGHAHVRHAAVDGGGREPERPAQPPPPDVRLAAKRTSGTPSTDATSAGSQANE